MSERSSSAPQPAAATPATEVRATAANDLFYEVQVFEDVAERTGQELDRGSVRGRRGACRSLTELASKSRRFGDGYYYLVCSAWPDETKTLQLRRSWQSLG